MSAAPVPQSKEWTLGAGILFGAIAAGMFVKGAFIPTGDYAADISIPKLTLGRVQSSKNM